MQKNTGSGWKDGTSWSGSSTSGYVTKYASSTASSGVLYRLKVTGTVTVNGKSESDTIYTKSCAI